MSYNRVLVSEYVTTHNFRYATLAEFEVFATNFGITRENYWSEDYYTPANNFFDLMGVDNSPTPASVKLDSSDYGQIGFFGRNLYAPGLTGISLLCS